LYAKLNENINVTNLTCYIKKGYKHNNIKSINTKVLYTV